MTTEVLVGTLLLLAMLVGIAGIVVPVLPGLVLINGAVLGWALYERSAVGWVVLAVCLALWGAAVALQYLVPGKRLVAAGVPTWVIAVAGLAGVVGFFVVPVIGPAAVLRRGGLPRAVPAGPPPRPVRGLHLAGGARRRASRSSSSSPAGCCAWSRTSSASGGPRAEPARRPAPRQRPRDGPGSAARAHLDEPDHVARAAQHGVDLGHGHLLARRPEPEHAAGQLPVRGQPLAPPLLQVGRGDARVGLRDLLGGVPDRQARRRCARRPR